MVTVVACIGANLISFMALLYFFDEVVRYLADLVGHDIGFQVMLRLYSYFLIKI